MLKGAVHIHSTFSDGELTLAELKRQFLSAGCSFICMTDHAEAFDDGKLDEYKLSCRSLSDDKFVFIPGLEFDCDRHMHILSVGLPALLPTRKPEAVIKEIEMRGGLSVIAHPSDAMFEWIRSFSVLPSAIEVWNTKYDGRYAPRASTFRLLAQLHEREPKMLAFYGQDLHWKRQNREMLVCVSLDAIEPSSILNALRAGNYSAIKRDDQFPSNGRISDRQLAYLESTYRRSRRMLQALKTVKRSMDSVGFRVPGAIKSRLRSIF